MGGSNKMTQNKTHAVMSQRHEDKDSKDYFPTPPWATRALFEKVLRKVWFVPEKFTGRYGHIDCLEPACGAGHMVKVLKEYFDIVHSADIEDYGQDRIADFLRTSIEQKYHYIITNPPFNLAEEFVHKALLQAKYCVAVFARTQFLESVGRYERLFKENPPNFVAQFTERVPILKGKLSATASTATSYAWFVWKGYEDKDKEDYTEIIWIPPCRNNLEKTTDYEEGVDATYPRSTSHASQRNLFTED